MGNSCRSCGDQERRKLKVRIERYYSLREAGKAQTDLASRLTAGKLLIEP